ncbi:MAG: peptidylprolyl isomerase [Hyphomicrobiales bacterium]
MSIFVKMRSRRINPLRHAFAAAGVAALLGAGLVAQPAVAADDPGKVVARVNGIDITTQDLDFAAADFAAELSRVPGAQQQKILIDVLVDLHLFAKEAEAAGLDKSPFFERRFAFLKARALRNAYFKEKIETAITDEDLKKIYDEEIGKVTPEDEIHARHILVKEEAEAKDIVKALKDGKDFAELAKEKSIDPGTAPEGGDLGYFTADRMVPEFSTAAFATKTGEISEPVKSEFGWHVIKVEDRRKQELPSFDEVKDQIKRIVMQERFSTELERLKAAAKIEMLDEPAGDKPAEEPKKDEPAK